MALPLQVFLSIVVGGNQGGSFRRGPSPVTTAANLFFSSFSDPTRNFPLSIVILKIWKHIWVSKIAAELHIRLQMKAIKSSKEDNKDIIVIRITSCSFVILGGSSNTRGQMKKTSIVALSYCFSDFSVWSLVLVDGNRLFIFSRLIFEFFRA